MSRSSTPAPAASSSWSAFLKSIASFNGDLSSLTAPPFILSSTSLTEFSSYWCEHPTLFAAPARESDPEKRALLVLKWFLSTLKQQYASRSEQYGNEKKPLNPFLGELFLGKWEDEAGTTELISEQVSHHPPATAYSIVNRETGTRLEGYNAQKATFSRTINVKQIGHAVLTVPYPDDASKAPETYLITLPSLHIEGLIYGAPFVELNSTSYITSSAGYTSKISYAGKGWLSGEKNSVSATLHHEDNDKDVLFNAVGVWTKSFSFYRGAAKSNSPKTLIETYDAATSPGTQLSVRPVEEQHPLESRRAWGKVAAAIAKGDMDAVGTEKGKIEHAQRELRAKEKEEGRVWERRFFSELAEPDEVLTTLAPRVGLAADGDGDKTGGLWRFDLAKEKSIKDAGEPSAEEVAKIEAELLGQ
ncbi:probable KES1 - involved in ergosterol biosynthesis [Cephalotrichum gorgonifer]|uniref:Probable KES1 - involved in ergosterol biosynthesis n=1 Tax=Cephalotrichum gorgonifer TaxID=2041049 RepID=A0AAE8N253_9PEZI|nr:probable KES1 - involved in ergosterol biosynthesis [Cephalotrichum gorgonifer]